VRRSGKAKKKKKHPTHKEDHEKHEKRGGGGKAARDCEAKVQAGGEMFRQLWTLSATTSEDPTPRGGPGGVGKGGKLHIVQRQKKKSRKREE